MEKFCARTTSETVNNFQYKKNPSNEGPTLTNQHDTRGFWLDLVLLSHSNHHTKLLDWDRDCMSVGGAGVKQFS